MAAFRSDNVRLTQVICLQPDANARCIVCIHNVHYTAMFPVGDTSCRTLIAVSACVCVCVCVCVCLCVCVCVSNVSNVSNFGYEPIKFSSLKLIK